MVNRGLKRIFGPKREMKKQGSGENYIMRSLMISPNIVWVIKSRRMRWVGHVACVGRGEAYTGF